MKLVFASLLLGFAACGGSDLDPGAGNDPGSGTNTLQVEGSVSTEARLSNARTAGDFDTEFRVRVHLNSIPVTTGRVSMTSNSGTIELAYVLDNNGEWRGNAAGYDEVYVMDVESGDDNVLGVRVDGPDLHWFTEPLAGASVDSTMPLAIKWERGDEAPSASIRADKLDGVAIADTGSYMLSIGALAAEKDKPKENELRLTRTDRVTPAGAAGGSELAVSVRNTLVVIAQPNPAL